MGALQQGRRMDLSGGGVGVEGEHVAAALYEGGHGEAEVLVELVGGRGQAEDVVDALRRLGVLLPARDAAGFDAHDGSAGGEDGELVLGGLLVEEFARDHRHA
eukprot:gene21888-27106_t